ncbi:unnamed protein product [Prorocentrum cordatum]|nr:unnamed protein product [Polarella glacialis]
MSSELSYAEQTEVIAQFLCSLEPSEVAASNRGGSSSSGSRAPLGGGVERSCQQQGEGTADGHGAAASTPVEQRGAGLCGGAERGWPADAEGTAEEYSAAASTPVEHRSAQAAHQASSPEEPLSAERGAHAGQWTEPHSLPGGSSFSGSRALPGSGAERSWPADAKGTAEGHDAAASAPNKHRGALGGGAERSWLADAEETAEEYSAAASTPVEHRSAQAAHQAGSPEEPPSAERGATVGQWTEPLEEFPSEEIRLRRCGFCGRSFRQDRLPVHEAVCARAASGGPGRARFDSFGQRCGGAAAWWWPGGAGALAEPAEREPRSAGARAVARGSLARPAAASAGASARARRVRPGTAPPRWRAGPAEQAAQAAGPAEQPASPARAAAPARPPCAQGKAAARAAGRGAGSPGLGRGQSSPPAAGKRPATPARPRALGGARASAGALASPARPLRAPIPGESPELGQGAAGDRPGPWGTSGWSAGGRAWHTPPAAPASGAGSSCARSEPARTHARGAGSSRAQPPPPPEQAGPRRPAPQQPLGPCGGAHRSDAHATPPPPPHRQQPHGGKIGPAVPEPTSRADADPAGPDGFASDVSATRPACAPLGSEAARQPRWGPPAVAACWSPEASLQSQKTGRSADSATATPEPIGRAAGQSSGESGRGLLGCPMTPPKEPASRATGQEEGPQEKGPKGAKAAGAAAVAEKLKWAPSPALGAMLQEVERLGAQVDEMRRRALPESPSGQGSPGGTADDCWAKGSGPGDLHVWPELGRPPRRSRAAYDPLRYCGTAATTAADADQALAPGARKASDDELASMVDSLELQSLRFQDYLRQCAHQVRERRRHIESCGAGAAKAAAGSEVGESSRH